MPEGDAPENATARAHCPVSARQAARSGKLGGVESGKPAKLLILMDLQISTEQKPLEPDLLSLWGKGTLGVRVSSGQAVSTDGWLCIVQFHIWIWISTYAHMHICTNTLDERKDGG